MTIATSQVDKSAVPGIRQIDIVDLRDVLAHGLDDFLAIPTQLIFLCLLYPIVGIVAARAAMGGRLLPLLYPMVAGSCRCLGRSSRVGLYELSRRREAGRAVSWVDAFQVVRAPSFFAVGLLGIMLLTMFVAWIAVAKAIYASTLGAGTTLDAPSAGVFVEHLLDMPQGWTLIIVGNAVGALFAIVVLSMTVIAVPMLIDRPVSPFTAMRTSLRAVAANPVTMAIWGLIVVSGLLLGSLPLFVGLAVAMPILGSCHLAPVSQGGHLAAAPRPGSLERHASLGAAGPDRLQRLHPGDMRRFGQPPRHLVLVQGVARDQPQQEVAATPDHVAFTDLGPAADQTLERRQHGLLLALQPDDGEEGDLPAELLRVCVRMIAAHDAGFLKAAHSAQARWGGDPRAAGEFDVRHAPVGLKLGQDAPVNLVEPSRIHDR